LSSKIHQTASVTIANCLAAGVHPILAIDKGCNAVTDVENVNRYVIKGSQAARAKQTVAFRSNPAYRNKYG
jgi:hypothetical protein